jgi:glucose-fructose oxidoreductase
MAKTNGSGGGNVRKRKIRYAVVGQGYISQVAVLPAFAHAKKNSELAALVSDDPVKLRKLSKKYDVPRTFSYDEYDACLSSGEIDAVYIALPNSMHREYTERAAAAGVHILCEKPMAVTEDDCAAMIRAASAADVKLMIAYRLHFDPANMQAVKMVRSGKLGEPRIFNSVFTMQVEKGNIRLKKDLGGGPLYDIGIYCINAARYLFQDEPVEVCAFNANNGEERFQEVEEMTAAILRFPNERLATFTCSFGAADVSAYEVVGTRARLRVDPAYEYAGNLKHEFTRNGKTRKRRFPQRDQFAPELLYFSGCILEDKDPEPSGTEGLIDVRIIRALYRSARSGQPVTLGDFEKTHRPGPEQEIRRPPVRKPELVHAASPSGEN